VQAAGSCWAEVIYSEDLADGQSYGDVRVINPLKWWECRGKVKTRTLEKPQGMQRPRVPAIVKVFHPPKVRVRIGA
jgi:hypothetical protein